MEPRPTPVGDPGRLDVLRETGLLDSPAEEAFDRLTRLVTRLLGVPVALVSLVDRDRQFFKSYVGLPEPWATQRESPLTHSFCQHTVLTGRELVVDDAREHPELRANMAVPDLGVIAYAGIPLTTRDGTVLGSFCAIDTKPRRWTEGDLATLRDLAQSAASEVELRMRIAAQERAEREQRAAEVELRRRDTLYRTLARHFPNGAVVVFDRELRYLIADGLGLSAVGLTREGLEGRTVQELFPESVASVLAPLLRGALAGEERVGELSFGGRLFVPRAVPIQGESGNIEHGLLVTQDMTAERLAEQRMQLLAESGQLLSLSLDLNVTLRAVARLVMPSLAQIALIDLVEDGVIRRATAVHADPAQAALVARSLEYAPHLLDSGPQAEVIRTGRTVERPVVDDAVIRSAGRGEEHVALIRSLGVSSAVIVPLPSGDDVLGALTLLRTGDHPAFDDGDRALAEELGRRAALAVHNARLYDSARRATRARDQMLGVVSHDLRNPIHTIFMSSSFMQDILPVEGSEPAREQARIIKRSAERANRLIGDLLDVTRIESGTLSLFRRPHDAIELCEEAFEAARLAAAERSITLVRELTDEPLPVVADRDRVVQALGNLIGNALKFTPADGRVTIAAARDGNRVRLTVSDTGPGIPAAHLPRLFDQFWQGDSADRRGVGLGLSIVRGIALGHDGDVRVESAPGAGSSFSLLLPMATIPAAVIAD